MANYPYVMWKEEGLWTAHSPCVPGVYGIAKTKAGAKKDFLEALGLLLDHLKSIGEKAPRSMPMDFIPAAR